MASQSIEASIAWSFSLMASGGGAWRFIGMRNGPGIRYRRNIWGSSTPRKKQRQKRAGALSASLSNIVLDELDRELERRHRFVRYADDCNIYVRSRGAGQRVMTNVTRFLTRRARGISLEQMLKELTAYLRGWKSYFGFCQAPSLLQQLDQW